MKPDLLDSEIRAVMLAIDQEQLYIHASWCFWHEGVRLFDDSYPGNFQPTNGKYGLRAVCADKQSHNGYAQSLINNSSNNELQGAFFRTSQRVESDHQLSTHFRWVAYHESMRRSFLDLAAQMNFSQIRSDYHDYQAHNSNAKNLLSCISNYQLNLMIDAL